MTITNRKINILLYTLIAATCCASVSCSEVERYGKEPERENILEVNQAPYKFHMFPEHRPNSETLLQLTIEKNGSPVDNALVAAKLVEHDGTEAETKFHLQDSTHAFEATATLKHHEDYLLKTEIKIDGKTLTPIFAFHNDDPALEKIDPSKHPTEEKH